MMQNEQKNDFLVHKSRQNAQPSRHVHYTNLEHGNNFKYFIPFTTRQMFILFDLCEYLLSFVMKIGFWVFIKEIQL